MVTQAKTAQSTIMGNVLFHARQTRDDGSTEELSACTLRELDAG